MIFLELPRGCTFIIPKICDLIAYLKFAIRSHMLPAMRSIWETRNLELLRDSIMLCIK